MKSRVTMQAIADKLNISKNSVSQALAGKDGVSEETRRLVVSTAMQMGYVYPGQGASNKNEARGKAARVALISSDFAFSQQFFGEICLTIEQECSKHGLQLMIQSISDEAVASLLLPSFLSTPSVDGVLVLSHLSTDYLNVILSRGIPAVMIDHHDPDIRTDCVLTNNRFGAYEAVRHLIRLGHKRIGFMGNTSFSPSYRERLDGYRLALETYGMSEDKRWIETAAEEEPAFVERYISGLKEKPSAWFCVNDGLGFMVTSSLRQLGLQIPKDVSVCSFDNGRLSRLTNPATTTVTVDLKQFGRKAVELLLWRMNNRDEPHVEVLLPASLIVRGSSASPNS
ncbi:LacI family DNA-binding transcriptional regulator [Paenibacillus thermotolerans]|uniref:LacI family DNA-binding transcriptional regulator n=1 Tax=Paenibacillus thermotolerans TaxID=3027807 RepID=UPI0023678000|nr:MULTISPECIES: LacI family DNA-binding transcriptional regulator [unclassified Paenibacillus]